MSFDIRKATANATKRTGDPLAAIKLDEAYKHLNVVGKLLTSLTDLEAAKGMENRLLNIFTDEELEKPNPALAIALASMLAEALIVIGSSFADDPALVP